MQVPYVLTTGTELKACIDTSKPLFFDTETAGLYGRVVLAQFYQAGWPAVQMLRNPDPYIIVALVSNVKTVLHNAHYDITVIQAQTESRWIPQDYACTFLAARLAMPDKNAFALDDVFEYVLGYDPYARQGLNKAVLQKSDWSKSKLTEDQLVYAATDVYFMPQVWDKVKHAVDTDSYKLDIHALNACLDFQWNGMPVLQNRLMALYEANKLEISKLNVPINVNSYQQVRAYLGVHASDDIALARLAAEGNDKAKNVRRVRKLRKQLSFIEKFDVASGIIYGKFKPSARSGRTTSSDQNLQQVPRAMKDCFGFEEDGDTVMIFSDYPQLELRTICAIVVCKLMERFFREGADLHGYTAEYLFGPNWTKNHRQITKTYNFNLLYGGGVAMIQTILLKQLGIFQSDAETASAKKKWRNLWREIAAWQDAGITKWQKGRLGSTPLGRQYKAKLLTDFLNIENQGAGAEVAKLAMHYLHQTLKTEEAFKEVKLHNFIHDSFILSAPNDPAIYIPMAEALAKNMQEAWFEMSKLFKINDLPMPIKVQVGFNWGEIEAGKAIYEYNLEPYAMLEKCNETI